MPNEALKGKSNLKRLNDNGLIGKRAKKKRKNKRLTHPKTINEQKLNIFDIQHFGGKSSIISECYWKPKVNFVKHINSKKKKYFLYENIYEAKKKFTYTKKLFNELLQNSNYQM